MEESSEESSQLKEELRRSSGEAEKKRSEPQTRKIDVCYEFLGVIKLTCSFNHL
jgi:hypothetical protein